MFGKKKPQIVVRQYKTRKEFQRDANALAKQGYRVQQQSEDHLGHGIFMGRATHRITVTYELATAHLD